MLSPEEPALAIFGSYKDLTVIDTAQSLADLSGFPVVIRPLEDNPELTLLAPDTHQSNVPVDLGATVGNTAQPGHNNNSGGALLAEGDRILHQEEFGNGGRMDDDLDGTESNGPGLKTGRKQKTNISNGAPLDILDINGDGHGIRGGLSGAGATYKLVSHAVGNLLVNKRCHWPSRTGWVKVPRLPRAAALTRTDAV
ncbi:hypothetical protein K438DRAFT_1970906 [Mycena galopus ATCC 62051]|nr:hypothetical protein K438DRAFT_1970906 [Mycena galopus ATCC 62051]